MKTTEFIATALEMGRVWLEALVADLDGDETVVAAVPGGNHALWVLGHLACSEASIIGGYVKGEPPTFPPGWDLLFGTGSTPVADAAQYPSKDDLLEQYKAVRGETLALLGSLTEADLEKETPAEMKEFFGTVGRCFGAVLTHQGFHLGQVADARRAMGRPPVFS